MIGELLKAIKSRWDVKDLVSTFTGGLHEGQLPPVASTPVMPIVSLDIIGASPSGRSTSTTANKIQQYETATVDFLIRARGGLSSCSTLVESLKAAYSNMHATLGSGVSLKRFFWQGESYQQDPDHPNVWEWTVTYEAELEQAQTAVNV